MIRKEKGLAKNLLQKWVQFQEKRKRTYFHPQLEFELTRLYPGVSGRKMVYEYYLTNISIGLKILGIGGILIFVYVCSLSVNGSLIEQQYIERADVGKGEKTVILDAQIGEEKLNDISIQVKEKELTSEEAQQLLDQTAKELPERILGENLSLYEVNKPLNLMNAWEDEPVSILWESSNYQVLREDGSLGEEIPESGVEVELTAVLSYKETEKTESIMVNVIPDELTKEERLIKDLDEEIAKNQEISNTSDYLILPDSVNDIPVLWKENRLGMTGLLIGLLIAAIGAVFWGKDQDLHKKYEERNRALFLEYSGFVSKLQLLIGSGMSMRGAFIRLGKDYQNIKNTGGEKKYVYEELLLAIRKMENGVSETEAYDYFSKRCDLPCYRKLISIILQNLRRGADGLEESLMNETKNAFEERKRTARKMGEEAGTKLLFPMMMIMGMVLVIILLPAYFSFGGI